MTMKEVMILQNAIEVKGLTKIYKDEFSALNKLNISVKKGEIYSLLGKNGAGKSTLINILTTFLKPTDGEVKILGKEITQNVDYIRSKLSCVAQKNSIDGYMTLYENMQFQGRLYHVNAKELTSRIDDLINTLSLEDYRNKKVSDCSGGVQRRLDIAMSMISIPELLFLDEPTTGMDIESRISMWELIKTVNKKYGTTIFLTTHYLEEADELSDRICIMKDGKEQIVGTVNELKKYLQQNLVRLYFDEMYSGTKEENINDLYQLDFVKDIHETVDTLTINVTDAQKNYFSILEFIIEKHIPIYRAEIVVPTLDDIFLAIANEEETYEGNW
ncbi:ABC transporter ATP-binding protein [Listeria monocytogenes]|nr:ABC transporter ATP-binding protein [Listeria monocytogenes]